ncbi:MAG: C39 family peptidase, partial [Clostridium sp.]|uniref:C39 family peptidase n=1 Tax=Clostridium sp. TaxID=1506 RepID=UPI002FCC6339
GWYKISYNGTTGYVRGDFVTLGGSSSVGSDGNLYGSSFKDGYIRYYAQDDPRYGGIIYSTHGAPDQTIAKSACGPTAFSIVVSTLNDIDVPPTEMCRYALAKGCRSYNSGTYPNLFSIASHDSSNPKYNLNYESTGSVSRIKNLLSDGKHLAIVCMQSGHVTRGGHYIVLSGWQVINGRVFFKVYDPHRWNENYIYDSGLIDTVKNDGIVLLSQDVIESERSTSYFVFSNKSNSSISHGGSSSGHSSSGSSSSHGSSSSGSGHSSSSSETVEKNKNFDPTKIFK